MTTNETALKTTLDLTPAGRAVVVLASLALGAAWTTGSEPARIAACLLLAPLLVDWAAKLRRFEGLRIEVPRRRTRAGAALVERITLRNARQRPVWDVHLAAAGLLASARTQPALVERLPAGGDLVVDLPLRARIRGVAPVRSFSLWTRHPLGLVRLHGTVEIAASTIVEPARIALATTPEASGRDGARLSARDHRNDGETFFALRELRDGDDWVRVHALRSAALGTPVRVQRRGSVARSARVLLDLRSPPGRSPSRYSGQAFEWGLSAAATLIDELTREGRTVDVVVLGRTRTSFLDLGGRGAVGEFHEFLAGARPQPHSPAPDATLSWLAAHDGGTFWIAAGGFSGTVERERAGNRIRVLEWLG